MTVFEKASLVWRDVKSELFRKPKTGPYDRQRDKRAAFVAGVKQVLEQEKTRNEDRFLDFCLRNITLSNSQALQDLFVLYVLNQKANGYFCEFGAADGISNSNTLALEKQLNWSGICAEPSRAFHAALRRNRPRAMIVEQCVWKASGETLEFRQAAAGQLSTIEAFVDADGRRPSKRAGETYTVATISLHDMLTAAGAPADFDYLSIDTEGSEFEILNSLALSPFRPKVITVEHNYAPARNDIRAALESFGYARVFPLISRSDDWYVLKPLLRAELI